MKTKRFFAMLSLTIFCLGIAQAQDFTATAPSGQELGYIIYGNGIDVSVVGFESTSGDLIIPSTVTYNGTTFTVTAIRENAFSGCTGLTSVTIPNTVAFIGDYVFYGCTGLTSIIVSSGNTHYDSRNNCNAIIETSTNTLIAGCRNTATPNSITSIGEGAFSGCTGLTSVTIPNTVTKIGFDAFSGCTGLTSVTIPNSVTTIEEYAFYGCTGLSSVTIGNSVTSIEKWAFYDCTGLTSITVSSDNTHYDSRDNCNAIIKKSTNTLIVGCRNTTISNSVSSIGEYAFHDCTDLTSVTIPNSVTSIEKWAFYGCTGLTSITFLPTPPPSIGEGAFTNVSSNATVVVPCEWQNAYWGALSFYAFGGNITCENNGGGNGSSGNNNEGGNENGGGSTSGDTVYVYVHDTIYIHDTVCPDVQGISPVMMSDISIRTLDRQIVVSGAESLPVALFDMQGRILASQQSRNSQPLTFDVPATGVYMIRVGSLPAQRVAVLR